MVLKYNVFKKKKKWWEHNHHFPYYDGSWHGFSYISVFHSSVTSPHRLGNMAMAVYSNLLSTSHLSSEDPTCQSIIIPISLNFQERVTYPTNIKFFKSSEFTFFKILQPKHNLILHFVIASFHLFFSALLLFQLLLMLFWILNQLSG